MPIPSCRAVSRPMLMAVRIFPFPLNLIHAAFNQRTREHLPRPGPWSSHSFPGDWLLTV